MFKRGEPDSAMADRGYLEILRGFQSHLLKSLATVTSAETKHFILDVANHKYRLGRPEGDFAKCLTAMETYGLRGPFRVFSERALNVTVQNKDELECLLDGLCLCMASTPDMEKEHKDRFRKNPEFLMCRIIELTVMT